jgi:hypothetical protein
MPPPEIKREFRTVYQQMLETFMAGTGDLPIKSVSDLSYGLNALLRHFEIKRRPIALDRDRFYATEDELEAEERARHAERMTSLETSTYKMTFERKNG